MRVRQATNEDVERFHVLFEKAHGNHSLYHVRTPEFYQWLLIKRPYVGLENILVAEREGVLMGFAAIGIKDLGVTTIISIYEMSAVDEESFHALMSEIQQIGREKKCAYLETMAPPQDEYSLKLREGGFIRLKDMIAMGYPITVKEILNLFVNRALSKSTFRRIARITFEVQGELFNLTLPEGTLDCASEGDLLIRISACKLLELLFKRTGILALVTKKEVVVKPWRRILFAHEVIEYLAEDVKAFTPYTELT
ncbi:MAG: hypothetical protein HXS52_06800 [Theionarchaea archaeon]|nr:hypothetical protein [Theionarchaea archaeon]MBU7037623.1 hypothetical protein [Theionarchaea archaeon]